MSKKDAKVSEAQLPMPPRVEQFVGVLQEWVQQKQGANQPPGSSMFGDEEQIGKPKNTKRTEAVAVNVAMEFQNVSVANKEVYKGLDEWLVGFVKFTVDVRAMNSEEIYYKKCVHARVFSGKTVYVHGFLQGHGNQDIRASNYTFAPGAIRTRQVLHEVDW